MGAITSGLSSLPMVGSLFPNQDEQAQNRMQLDAASAYSQYRPELAKARTEALKNRLGAYAGAQQALGQMYGGVGPNMQALSQNPATGLTGIGGVSYTTDGPNAGDVLGGMAKGAGIGAMAGSVVPGLGTLAGGAVGAGLGALGSMGTEHNNVNFRRR